MDNYVGKRLDGRYEIQEIIGVGGMAVVYKAYDNIDDRIVAVKILKEEFLANEEFRRRFKNESKAIAVLSHPNIVKVYDVSFGDKLQYIVMEYIDGIALKEYIEQQGAIKCREAVHFTSQILRALQHAHDKGIVHRDIKPQNIMLLQNGSIKVTDFGIARFSRSETRTMTERAIGSVHYISPEQARGEITDEKSDVYSVGVLMYEMLTGQLPFQSENAVSVALMQLQADPKNPRELNASIPAGLEQIIMHAMQKNPSDRYQSAAEMLKDVEDFKRNPDILFAYTFFVDRSPTRFFANANGAEASQENGQPPERKKSRVIPYLTGVAIAFVLALIVLIIALGLTGGLGGSAEDIKVPELRGLEYAKVIADVDVNSNFKIEKAGEDYSADYAAGQIMKQDPQADAVRKKNSVIKVTVSLGPKMIQVPDVKGKDASTAKAELVSAGFKVLEERQVSNEVPKGLVIKTIPETNAQAKLNDTVTIFISKGQFDEPVKVPNLIGMDKDAAKDLLDSYGLNIKILNKDSTVPAGTILSQLPLEQTEVEKGSDVEVYVSTGKATERSIDILFNLPLAGDFGVYEQGKMQVFIDNIEDTTFTTNVRLSGGTNKITISRSSGIVNVSILVVDLEVYTCTVDFSAAIPVKSKESSISYVKIPSVLGMSEAEATKKLTDFNLKPAVEYVNSADTSPGRVVIQSTAGSFVRKFSYVTIKVSKTDSPSSTTEPVIPAGN